jgi:pyruvate ferredoxin oxidoreductase alpha subunit
MGKRVAISGNHSIAEGVRLAKVDVVAAYPITPQTPMVEKVADFINQGRLDAKYIAVESEHSALTAVVGASVMGTRVFTASAGAGLALMHEIVGVASGNRLPIVMGIANRSLPSPWSLQADHSDSMAERDLGWIQLYAASCQEALDYTLLAYRIAEEVRLPVMVCIDGFFLTHTTEAVDLPDQADVDQFLPAFERGDIYLDPDDPMTINQLNSEATFTELKYRHNEALNSVVDLFPHVAKEFEERFGRKHSLCTAVGCEGADVVVVTLGSSSGTGKCLLSSPT